MSDGILDRDVLARIGTSALRSAGIDGEVVKQWRRRGISFKARPLIRDIARDKGVALPADFDTTQRPAPKAKRPRHAPKKRRAA